MTAWPVIKHYSLLPFEYGTTDCCQFVGACLEWHGKPNPMLGLDYSGPDEAQAIIDKHGSLYSAVTHYLGEPIAVDRANPNDVALVVQRGKQMLGVVCEVCGENKVALRTESSIVDWPLSKAIAIWRV